MQVEHRPPGCADNSCAVPDGSKPPSLPASTPKTRSISNPAGGSPTCFLPHSGQFTSYCRTSITSALAGGSSVIWFTSRKTPSGRCTSPHDISSTSQLSRLQYDPGSRRTCAHASGMTRIGAPCLRLRRSDGRLRLWSREWRLRRVARIGRRFLTLLQFQAQCFIVGFQLGYGSLQRNILLIHGQGSAVSIRHGSVAPDPSWVIVAQSYQILLLLGHIRE